VGTFKGVPMLSILLFVFAVSAAPSANYATVPTTQFQTGNHWTWTYSSLNTDTGVWTPYLSERYTVTANDGRNVTIEMSSSPYPYTASPAHHKMIVDMFQCAKAAQEPSFKHFSLQFFTKSLGDGWQPVPAAQQNLVFTEKFNCAGPLPSETSTVLNLLLADGAYDVFQVHSGEPAEMSWYFLNRQGLAGVAAYKLFLPDSAYKFEFAEYCDQGLSCLNR